MVVDDAAAAACFAGAVAKDEIGRDRIREDSSGRHDGEDGDIGDSAVILRQAWSLVGAATDDFFRHHCGAGGMEHFAVSETMMILTIVVMDEVVLWRECRHACID